MSNSNLVSYTKISPNKSSPRNHAIDTITIHCVVGQCSVEALGEVFSPTSRQASSNYGIGYDGKIGMYVEEKDRSWCSSNAANDNRAITIEVASDTTHPYAVNSKAYAALIDLLTDICKRNGIKQLLWRADKSMIGQPDKQNMTVHRWFANKACPGDYLYNKHSEIAAEVNKRLGVAIVGTSASAGCYASKLLEVAAAEVGYHEKATNGSLDDKTANSGSGNFTKYARDFDEKFPTFYNGNKNGFAWCDMFVDWCFVTAFGVTDALRLLCQPSGSCGAGCNYSLGYYKQKGQMFTTPKVGDQIFFGTSAENVQHTGIVYAVDASRVYTIEGNTSDQVAKCSYSLTDRSIVGYGRPAYDTEGAQGVGQPTAPAVRSTEYTVGDEVQFTGTKHYASASAHSSASCKPGKAVVTQIYKSGKHPYHLKAVSGGGSNVYGWVDAADIAGKV